MHHAVGGQNDHAGTIHVDQCHHDQFVGRGGGIGSRADVLAPRILKRSALSWGRSCRPSHCPALVAIGQRGFIAVMAIGNDQLLVPHLAPHQVNQAGIGYLPDPVRDSIFVEGFEIGKATGGQQTFDFGGRIAVQHEKLPKVGPGGP